MKKYMITVFVGCVVWIIAIGCSPSPMSQKEEAQREQNIPEKEKLVSPKAVQAPVPEMVKVPLTNDGAWKIAASSVERMDLDPTKAVDGNLNTRWSSEFKDAQWWMVDFGKIELLNAITIYWEDAFARMFSIDLSLDGHKWETILSERNGSGGRTDLRFEPRPARWVRVYCDTRATPYGFSFFEVQFNNPESPAITASASSGSGDYAARYAIDGNLKTRWSSDFRDGEWWQVEFGQPRVVSGLQIHWETAFAEKYDVVISDDGKLWQTVYQVTEGDGQTDLLLFGPVTTRIVRLSCQQRGTGWGNSIWEIGIYEKPARATASSALLGAEAEKAIDGDPKSAWRSAAGAKQWWMVELPEERDLGGVILLWGDRYATEYDVEVSENGQDWKTMYREEFGNGGYDYIFYPSTRSRFVRIACKRGSSDEGYDLKQFEPKSGEEQVTPLRAFQAAARNAPRGRYPMWLLRQQEFWTIVGLPDDDQESLIGETGTVEPFKGGFTVQPLLQVGRQIVTWADVNLSQALADGYLPLPSVAWEARSLSLNVAAVTIGQPGAAQTAVRYRVTNRGTNSQTVHLVLAVRALQLNPVWQHGGMSRIEKAEYVRDTTLPRLLINGRPAILLPTVPTKAGASTLTNGDVTDFLERGGLPDITMAMDPEGKAGAGILYELGLAPGKSKDVVVVLPLHNAASLDPAWTKDPARAFDSAWTEARRKWHALLDTVTLDIPDKKIQHVLKSNLAYVMINRDPPWFKPGSRNYNHSWMRDGALTGEAMLRLGCTDMVKEFVLHFHRFVNPQGWVPFMIMEDGKPCGFNPDMNGGEGHEFDSQGEFVFIVRRYYDFTQDRKTLETVYPAVVRALEYGRAIRRMRMTDAYRDTEFWGILPHSNSHEGYFPAKHSYWDDFWMLRGLKDGAYLAEVMGKPEDAQWMREEEKDLRACLLASIEKVVSKYNLSHIPGCAELGDEDPTSTSVAIMACDETDHLPKQLLMNTFERYQQRIEGRYRGHRDSFTPYEARNAEVFVRLGQRDRALALIRYLVHDCTRPPAWNHLAEVVHAEYRVASYIGDMPHTWVGSDLINAILSSFVYDQGNALILGAGLATIWSEAGLAVNNLATPFGHVGYRLAKKNGTIRLSVTGDAQPPDGFVWVLPEAWRDRSATVDGAPVQIKDGAVHFRILPSTIELALAPEMPSPLGAAESDKGDEDDVEQE